MNREPVAIAAAVRAVVACAVAFGLDWTAGQVAALVVAVEVVSGLFVRSQVTPVASGTDGERGAVDPGSLALGVVLGVVLMVLLYGGFP